MAYVILNLVCVAALVGIDQAIKLWAVQALAPVESITLIPHVLELRFVLNQGMAFSLLSGRQLFLILTTTAALLLVAYMLFFRSRGRLLRCCGGFCRFPVLLWQNARVCLSPNDRRKPCKVIILYVIFDYISVFF